MLKSCINNNKKKLTETSVSFIQLRRSGYPLSGCSSALPDSVSPRYCKFKVIKLSEYKFFWAPNRYCELQHFDKHQRGLFYTKVTGALYII
jgi:hypothetical protein